jgi:hypothetical protein
MSISRMPQTQPLPKSIITHGFFLIFETRWVQSMEPTLPALHLQENVQPHATGKGFLLRTALWLVDLIFDSFMFLVGGRVQQQIRSFSMMLVREAFPCLKGNTI